MPYRHQIAHQQPSKLANSLLCGVWPLKPPHNVDSQDKDLCILDTIIKLHNPAADLSISCAGRLRTQAVGSTAASPGSACMLSALLFLQNRPKHEINMGLI